jgi:predicted  nucleic acid-binding Zn-ribbon protein
VTNYFICIQCDNRYGIAKEITISMCPKCVDNHRSKKKNKVRDYSGFEEASEIVYSRVKLRAAPIKNKPTLEYLR